MKAFFLRTWRFILLLPQVKSIGGAWFFSGFTGNFILDKTVKYKWKNGAIHFQDKGLSLRKKTIDRSAGRIFHVLMTGVQSHTLKENEDGTMRATVNSHGKFININITTPQAMIAANEVFGENAYDIYVNDELVVVDVGMNIGLASLYFAGLPNVSKVYSFEPFEETFRLAQENFAINPGLSDKIIPVQAGLGKENTKLSFPKPVAGFMGASTTEFFLKEDHIEEKSPGLLEEVEIQDVSNVMKKIRDENNSKNILLKLDCEGAEYEIMEALDKSGGLERVAYIMIEWHIRDKSVLIETLRKNNFRIISPDKGGNLLRGMIYAFRN
jgi:FkbM family methyltransferase